MTVTKGFPAGVLCQGVQLSDQMTSLAYPCTAAHSCHKLSRLREGHLNQTRCWRPLLRLPEWKSHWHSTWMNMLYPHPYFLIP